MAEFKDKDWPINEWLSAYEVTKDGRVFAVGTNWRGYGKRELVQQINTYGYPSVRLSLKKARKTLPVHRLVAHVHIGPKPSNDHQIRHLDGTRTNNDVGNLAWGTAKDNADDRSAHGRTSNGYTSGTLIPKMRIKQAKAALAKAEGGPL